MQDPTKDVQEATETEKAAEDDKKVATLPAVAVPKRGHVKLNRAQRAEVRLAFMTIREAETRFKAAQEAASVARNALMGAKTQALEVQGRILQELDLAEDNIIDVENLVVLPPEGVSFVKGRND